jgi:hypothetical protein
MVKIRLFSKKIDESLKGGQRYRRTMASAISDFIIEKIKSGSILKTGVYSFSLEEVFSGVQTIPEEGRKILNNLKVAVLEMPNLLAPAGDVEGTYLPSKAKKEQKQFPNSTKAIESLRSAGVEPLQIEMNPGDILIKFFIKSSIIPETQYESLVKNFRSVAFHELKHWVDDVDDRLAKSTSSYLPKDSSDSYELLKKDLAKNFAKDIEIAAYAEQNLNDARDRKEDFLKVLQEAINKYIKMYKINYNSQREHRLIDFTFLIWHYKVLKYIKSRFNKFNSYTTDEQGKKQPTPETLNVNVKMVQLANKIESINPNYQLRESKVNLSKYWKQRAKARAKRAGRSNRSKVDKEWASGQQGKSEAINSTFMSLYEKDLEMSEELQDNVENMLKKFEEEKFVVPNKKNLKTRAKPGPNPYLDPEYRKTKFKSRMDYLAKKGKKVHVGDIAPIAEKIIPKEEKGDGKSSD